MPIIGDLLDALEISAQSLLEYMFLQQRQSKLNSQWNPLSQFFAAGTKERKREKKRNKYVNYDGA